MTAPPRVVVVGAGPAGARAALAAARGGIRVVLVDGEPRVGGQYHRHPLAEPGSRRLHPLERSVVAQPRIEHLSRATVWALEAGPRPGSHLVHLQQGSADAAGRTQRTLVADALVLCTGAYDRVLPFPGWELPGVVTAGAARALAVGQRTAVGRRVVVSGTGPFLLPAAVSLLTAGSRVAGVYEAGKPSRWLRNLPAALRDGGPALLAELASYAGALARHRVPCRSRRAVVAAHGDGRVEAVTVARLDARWGVVPGSERVIAPVDALCVGYGFLPQLELPLAAGCLVRDGRVVVDARQATSAPGVYAAGEVTGVAGPVAAAAEGELAGLAAAADLSRACVPAREAAAAARVRAGRRFAAALEETYPIREGWRSRLTEDTLVCRCEEVTYGQLRDAVTDRGADAMRTIKLTCRVGLGACQGRICGRNAADLVAGLLGRPPADTLATDRRPLAHPVRLGDLASGPDGPPATC
ncbi:NADPH-dependent 2,4-dienoyl-CoA reductase/sulfur reductase-like enzyme [Streptomyces olivoverticillatus]|uniref:NADPH-dependent 2,4-dienoyl-CoA reductase/sulfur reductase-like enzyme n=1 Tax=Streptomyces olivoverticillatus TaxID=66427 RepID=A0A7W7LR24_9ACTN|nr:NADPH-dependent 2,4-dienoyl-CoA reductase/sulfur reductase-like enzyme [Streptomyces olivoverticillatus]